MRASSAFILRRELIRFEGVGGKLTPRGLVTKRTRFVVVELEGVSGPFSKGVASMVCLGRRQRPMKAV